MSSGQQENINNDFFNGYYKDIWRSLIPEGLTKAEVEFLIHEAKLQTGSKVLDLMCGYGRHALALARKGIEVTAVDNLKDYVNEVREISTKENLPITVVSENVIEFDTEEKYDLVICMGNSICFFDQEELQQLINKIYSILNRSGRFIFHTWLIAEIAIKLFQEKSWENVGNLKCLYNKNYLFSPARIETEATFIAPNGITEVKMGIDYIYSLNETENMLRKSGFTMKEVWSIPGKKKFILGEPRAYIVAERI